MAHFIVSLLLKSYLYYQQRGWGLHEVLINLGRAHCSAVWLLSLNTFAADSAHCETEGKMTHRTGEEEEEEEREEEEEVIVKRRHFS